MPREHTKSPPPLADDLLIGAEAIAEYTGESVRRVRHLIDRHDFPCFRRGRIIYGRKSWCDRYYGGEAPGHITFQAA